MKKFELTDLTPAMMRTIEKLTDTDAVIRFLNEKGLEISTEQASALMEKLSASEKLNPENLANVAGGWEVRRSWGDDTWQEEMDEVYGRSTGTTYIM